MKEGIPIKTIALEGLHRSGKGTQLEILKNKIESIGIPCVIIRGAGSRPNTNNEIGDKYSEWWKVHLNKLRGNNATKADWIEGSRRLAREVIIFKKKLLPELAEKDGANRAVLLIDRSVLSHMAMLGSTDMDNLDLNAIYGNRDIRNRSLPSTQEIFPDIMKSKVPDPPFVLSKKKLRSYS